jgi:DNA invertase Pin-like site-specific DNA recombinase
MISQQVTSRHLQRQAYLYVRQSTLQQVIENTESTARQYALRERAVELGWKTEQVVVIDQDLGHSGASSVDRAGFQRLVADVGLGKVGLVLGLEVSRLARSSSDWHQLLEICALTQTLILDEDGLYDPATFNDRLLLGLKGTMSEAELYVLRARLQGGLLNKARRGALKMPLPIGFCYTENDRITLDPDQHVQETIRFLFSSFRQVGSAFATVRAFRQEQVAFPRRIRSGAHQGELIWGALRNDDVLRMLHNPTYAGMFVFGRTRTTKTVNGKVNIENLPREQWQVVIPNVHVGYITSEEYEENLAQLAANSRAYTPPRLCPAREGPALLQGLVLCGRCGEHMTVRYHQRGGQRIIPDYICQKDGITYGTAPCQRIPGRDLDAAMNKLLREMVTPQMVAQTLKFQDELVERAEEAQRLRQRMVERARYEADLAQRRYLKVDPDNRLVAQVLEAEWNDKLRMLENARESAEEYRILDQMKITEPARQVMIQATEAFSAIWDDPHTPVKERKRIIRLLIEDVTLLKTDGIVAHIRFKGGAVQTLVVPLPPPFNQSRLTPADVLVKINQLIDTCTDTEIARQLNALGCHTFNDLLFTSSHVYQLRRRHGMKNRYDRLRDDGMLTVDEMADQLKVTPQTIWRWYRRGLIKGACYNDRGSCLFSLPDKRPKLDKRRHRGKEVQYAMCPLLQSNVRAENTAL